VEAIVQKAIKSKLKKVQELKSFDTGFGSSVSSTATITDLTTIPQGDTDSARDGDAIRVKRMEQILSWAPGDTTNTYRQIIFRWNQDDVVAPVVTDVLQLANAFSPYNRDTLRAKKFSVIDDWFSVTGLNGPSIDKHVFAKAMEWNISFYSGGTSGTNKIYSLQISDSGAVTHPFVNSDFRVYFTDS
jgi:hypothetical protein